MVDFHVLPDHAAHPTLSEPTSPKSSMIALVQFSVMAATLSQIIMAYSLPIISKSTTPFSSSFHQPSPPLVKPAFTANFNQHKWNENVSHITSGYWYSSPSAKKVRIDEAYDLNFASSLFDYNNVTNEGVNNVLWYLTPSIASTPQFYVGYEPMPSFPLFSADLLVADGAVYAGTTDSDIGELALWNIMYEGTIPATLQVDNEGVVHGFDYWSPHERTFVITRLFNIATAEPPVEVFDFPKPMT